MKHFKKIHFIGIGGIGISSLVYLSLEEGKKVTGSDTVDSALISDLRENNAIISIGHKAENITIDTELVIYSEAIDTKTNPEYIRARDMGVPLLSYFEALGQLSQTKKTIVVIGTHGKTTTTAMLGLVLISSWEDPTVIVGSKLKEFNQRNVSIGKGDLLVVEGCEYRRSFLNLDPFGVVLLNCEAEHLDYYKNEQDYMDAYIEFIRKIPIKGFLVANMDDKNVQEIVKYCAVEPIPVKVSDLKEYDFNLKIIGDFNKLNALHAYKAATTLNADPKVVKKTLEQFQGTWRRLELKGKFNGALLIDDYGHHPTEVFVTLKAIKEKYPEKRLICVFQPHQYSRTHLMIEEFKGAFRHADKVIIGNIYATRDTEADMAKIDSEKMAKMVGESHPDAIWGKDFDYTYNLLKNEVKKDDVVVTMGAGNISELSEKLAKSV